jgi:hypothetical protein
MDSIYDYIILRNTIYINGQLLCGYIKFSLYDYIEAFQ